VDDFGFIMSPIAITGLRAVGRVHDAMVTRRTLVGWPPMVVGLDDGRLSAPRGDTFSEAEIIGALESASADSVREGAVGAGAGLIAFGWKSGVGSASRRMSSDGESHLLGAIAFLNLGRPAALRLPGAALPSASATRGLPPLLGSAFVLVATDAPLDDRQCRRLAEAACAGLGRIGVVAGPNEGVVSAAVSTGVLLTRNDRAAPAVPTPRSSDALVGTLAEAAAEAAEDAATRTLTSVDPSDGTDQYPAVAGRSPAAG
jgi:D-aminopeptidase